MPQAVILDLDGVLLDSEPLWNQVREDLVREAGGRWPGDAPHVMMGMSSTEWSAYLHDELGVPNEPQDINRRVMARIEQLYRAELPLLPGAIDAVRDLARRWPLGLASSSNREIIELVLELTGLADAFGATVSSEEVPTGKPAPDVYLAATAALEADARSCVAVEDSSNGLRSAYAAGLAVIAVPNLHYPPAPDALALAVVTVATIGEVTPIVIERAAESLRA